MILQQNPVVVGLVTTCRSAVAGLAAFGTAFGCGADATAAGYRPFFSAPAYRPAPTFSAPVYRPAPVFHAPVYRPAPVFSPPVYRPAPVYSAPVYRPAPQPFVAPVVRPLPVLANQPFARPAAQVPSRPQLPAVVQPSVRPLVSQGPSAIAKAPQTSLPGIVTTAAQSTPAVSQGSSQIAKIGSAASQALNSKPAEIAANSLKAGLGNVVSHAGTFATAIAGKNVLSDVAISNLNKAGLAAKGVSYAGDAVKVYGAAATAGPNMTDKLLSGGSVLAEAVAVKAAGAAAARLGGPVAGAVAAAGTQAFVDTANAYIAPRAGAALHSAGLYPGASADSKYLQQSNAQTAQMEARLAQGSAAGARPATTASVLSMGGASRPVTADEFTQIILK